MGSINKWLGIGNLGRDAELRYTPGGAPVTSFSIACTEKWEKDGQKQERTEWVRCVLWGKRGEAVAEYLTKGKQIYVEGKLQTRKWQDKDGHDKFSTEVRVDDIVLLGGKSDGASGGTSTRRKPDEPHSTGDPAGSQIDDLADDDIPFIHSGFEANDFGLDYQNGKKMPRLSGRKITG